MKGKEDLFHLIKTMSPSEKRYFTLDAQKSSRKGNRYLELFQIINNMEEYDEEALRRRFPRSLPFDKSYLYEAILRVMRDYHSAGSRSAQIKERLLDARFLFERGLYDQCRIRLEEVGQLAAELGDHLALLELNREYRRLAMVTQSKELVETLERLTAEEAVQRRAVEENFQYLRLYEQLLVRVIRQFSLRTEEEKRLFQESMPEVETALEQMPETAGARLRYYQSLALYHQLLGDFERVMEYFSKVVEWWDEHPQYKEEEFYRYIVDFSNLLHAYITNGQAQRMPQLLSQLESTEANSETARRILFQRVTIYRLLTYINLGLSTKIEALEAEIGEGLEKFSVQLSTRSAIIFNMAILLFIQGKFADCRLWCERIIGDRKSKYRQDIRNTLYLLNLFATLELEDVRLLEGVYRSTYRYLRKQENWREGSFEARVLEYIRDLMNEPLSAWSSVRAALEQFLKTAKQDPEIKVNHGFDELLLMWIRSKTSRRSIAELIREQV